VTTYYHQELDELVIEITREHVRSDISDFEEPVALGAIEGIELRAHRRPPRLLVIPSLGMLLAVVMAWYAVVTDDPLYRRAIAAGFSIWFAWYFVVELRRCLRQPVLDVRLRTPGGDSGLLYRAWTARDFDAFVTALQSAYKDATGRELPCVDVRPQVRAPRGG
jgi:hypothetical protein